MKEKANLLRKSFISTLTAFVINTFLIFVLLFWGLMSYTVHNLNTNIPWLLIFGLQLFWIGKLHAEKFILISSQIIGPIILNYQSQSPFLVISKSLSFKVSYE